MELWRDIRGYEGLYQVSNYGRVRSLDHYVKNRMGYRKIEGKVLAHNILKSGHHYINLSKNSVVEPKPIHVLVAIAFIPNPNGYEIVHHIDHNPSNNKVENLMWMSKEGHNALHNSKKVDQIDKVTGEVLHQWDSLADVERELGYKNQNISACCMGKIKSYKGCIWKYASSISN